MGKIDILENFHESYKLALETIQSCGRNIVLFTDLEVDIKDEFEHPKSEEVQSKFQALPVFYYHGKHGFITQCSILKVDTEGVVYGLSSDMGEFYTTELSHLEAHAIINIFQEL